MTEEPAEDRAGEPQPLGRLEIEMDGHPVRTWILVGLAIVLVVMGLGVWWTYVLWAGGL